MKQYIGIDVGGSFIKYGILSEEGHILTMDKCPTHRTQPENVLSELSEIINSLKKNHPVDAVGISIPGVINQKDQLITSGAIDRLYEYDVHKILRENTGMDVFLTNDANAIAYAEKWIGAGKNCENFVCLPLGTGVGGAVIINGQVIKGRTGATGEFGMMLMELDLKDSIGYSSASYFSGAIAGLCRIYNKKLGNTDFSTWECNIQTILDRAEEGQPEAVESFEEFYHNVSILLLNISVAIDPEKILIGGGISENPTILSGIQETFINLSSNYKDIQAIGTPEIISCSLGNQAGMIGAVSQIIERRIY